MKKNRESACRSRLKKKMSIKMMKVRVAEYEKEKQAMSDQVLLASVK